MVEQQAVKDNIDTKPQPDVPAPAALIHSTDMSEHSSLVGSSAPKADVLASGQVNFGDHGSLYGKSDATAAQAKPTEVAAATKPAAPGDTTSAAAAGKPDEVAATAKPAAPGDTTSAAAAGKPAEVAAALPPAAPGDATTAAAAGKPAEVAAAVTPAAPGDATTAAAAAKPTDVAAPATVGDGASRVSDLTAQPGDKPPSRSDQISYNPADIQASKEKLTTAIQEMPPAQKAEIQQHMDDLEHRVPPVTADQINKIYDATTKLLTDPEHTSPLNQTERNRLANDIVSNAAQQHEIDQGYHDTCNVTTLEETLNRQSPELGAQMVSQVGLTGKYISPSDGKEIQIDPKTLHPDGEASLNANSPGKDGSRNYASQLFDMATVNDYWQHQNPPLTYSQTTPTGQGDTGERLTYSNGQEVNGPDGKPMRQPGLGTEAMGWIGKDIGLKGNYIVSSTELEHSTAPGGVGDDRVSNIQDFQNALTKNPTSVIFVNSGDKLFTGTDDKGGSGGGHVVTVSDFKTGPPAEVYMRNQWGSANNKWVSVAELYNSTLPPGSAGKVETPVLNQGGGNQGQGEQGGLKQGQGDQGHQSQGDQGGLKPDQGDQGGLKPSQGDQGYQSQGDQGGIHQAPVDQGGRGQGPSDQGTGGDRPWNRNDGVMGAEQFMNWLNQINKEKPTNSGKPRHSKTEDDDAPDDAP